MKLKISIAWKIPLLLLMLASAGCSPRGRIMVPEGSLSENICILEPAFSNRLAQLALAQLADVFPKAPVFSLEQSPDWLARCLAERKVLVIPDARHVPVEFWGPLTNFLAAGGAAVLWGCDPFEARVQRMGRELVTEDAQRLTWPLYAESVAGISGIAAWQHVGDQGRAGGVVRMTRDEKLPWPGVLAEVPAFESKDGMVLADIPSGEIPSRLNTMIFFARGDPALAHLVVECEGPDGARWHHVIRVSDEWQPCFLHQALLRRVDGQEGRLEFSKVRSISIGLNSLLSPLAPGTYVLGLSDVRFIYDGRPTQDAIGWPDLPLVSPPFRRYDVSADSLELIYSGQRLPVAEQAVQSPLPRAIGTGGERGAASRWIPLARLLDANGACIGWPASVYVEPGADGPPRQWAWIGVDPSEDNASVLQKLLRLCVWRLRSGHFLHKSGVDQFVVMSDQRINVSTRWIRGLGENVPVRVAAELLDAQGSVMHRTVTPPLEPGATGLAERVELSLGVVPTIRGAPRDMMIRMSLVDRDDRRMLDYIEQPVKFLPRAQTRPETEDRIEVTGSRFTMGKRPLFLLGVAYQPSSTTGLQRGERTPHWLDASVFDPVVVRRDLDRLRDGGFNALSITYEDETQAPQLRYLVDEAQSRRMWIQLRLHHLQPLDYDGPRALQLLAEAGLPSQTRVFALDLMGPDASGYRVAREPFDDAWRRWLLEQYGTMEHAEKVIGAPLWRDRRRIVGPSAADLQDEKQAAAVAVYRRFADDFMSRHYGSVRRFLRHADCRQLLTARGVLDAEEGFAAGDIFPLDPAGGAHHLDFVSLGGASYRGLPGQMEDAAFAALYARGATGGRPVVWLDMGVPVGADPQPADLTNQARVAEQFLDMSFRSQAAGVFASWYPAGLRQDGVDAGLVNPDTTWRPAGEFFRAFTHRLRRDKLLPLPWRGRTLDRDASPRGVAALRETWREPLSQEMRAATMEEFRPQGFGKESRNLDVVSVGGSPYEEPAPMALMNAEWGGAQLNGTEQPRPSGEMLRMATRQTARLELINTGPTTWTASDTRRAKTVWVRARDPQGREEMIEIKSVPFGDRVWVPWTASDPGVWTFQPWLSGVGTFGEPLFIEVGQPRT